MNRGEKQPGASLSSDALFDKVASIIAHTSGFSIERITHDTRLAEDIGVAGDDGDALLKELDEAFFMDWDGIDAGVIFGNEGLGPPPLWLLRNNCELFEPQTLTVGELIDNLHVGRWMRPTPLVRRRGWRLRAVYAGSACMTLLWGSLPLILIAWLFGWLLGS